MSHHPKIKFNRALWDKLLARFNDGEEPYPQLAAGIQEMRTRCARHEKSLAEVNELVHEYERLAR